MPQSQERIAASIRMVADGVLHLTHHPRQHLLRREGPGAARGRARLGELVGELVREQGGEALFDFVEAARRASIAHREGDTTRTAS